MELYFLIYQDTPLKKIRTFFGNSNSSEKEEEKEKNVLCTKHPVFYTKPCILHRIQDFYMKHKSKEL